MRVRIWLAALLAALEAVVLTWLGLFFVRAPVYDATDTFVHDTGVCVLWLAIALWLIAAGLGMWAVRSRQRERHGIVPRAC
jgi:hypothetical protein